MIYLLIGEESIIKKQIKDIIVKNNIDFNSVINYDLENDNIKNVIEDLNTYNLFGDKKIVIVKNINKLDDEMIIEYLNNPSSNILVFISCDELDKRKKINKEILKVSEVINTKDIDLSSFIKDELKDYTYDNDVVKLLKNRCCNNYFKISNELEKLKMLKIEEHNITKDDILLYVKKSFDTNIFDLTNYINRKDIKKSLEVLKDLLNNSEDELRLLGLLANNFRTLYMIKNMMFKYNDDYIIDTLKMHPYRLKMLKEQAINFSIEDLQKLIKKLGTIDINVKSGFIDKNGILEEFILTI